MTNGVFRVLVTTDNHLGYKQFDDVCNADSFNTLEECLLLAESLNVDLLIQVGDFFDNANPNQYTLNRAFKVLTKYCYGYKEHKFTVDEDVNIYYSQNSSLNVLNNDILDVKLPIFMIHGNHDPPLNRNEENFSCIELFELTKLVNNIGKCVYENDKLVINPVVLCKDQTIVLIYGIGYIRDTRLNHLISTNKLDFKCPASIDIDKCFCILLLHQNRYRLNSGVPITYAINEDSFPNFINLILWGHEHEHIPYVKLASNKKTFIHQPGSSIVTSLKEVETKTKCISILEIRNIEFKIHNIPLLTARPFSYITINEDIIDDVSSIISNINLGLEDIKKKTEIRTAKWYKIMSDLYKLFSINSKVVTLYNKIISIVPQLLPLVRLRIMFVTCNVSFNSILAKYKDKIANYQDVILIKSKHNYKDTLTGTDKNNTDDLPGMEEDDNMDEAIYKNINPSLKLFNPKEITEQVKLTIDGTNNISLPAYIENKFQTILNNMSNVVSYNDAQVTFDELLKSSLNNSQNN